MEPPDSERWPRGNAVPSLASAAANSRPRDAEPLKSDDAVMRGRVTRLQVVSEPRRKAHHKCWVIGLGAGEHGPRQSRAGGVRLAFDLVDLAAGFFDLATPGFRPNPIFFAISLRCLA